MRAHEIAGRRIRDARKRLGMSGEELGQAMAELGFEMSRATVSKVEQGTRPLTLDELFAAAWVLGTSPLALLEPDAGEPFDIGDGATVDDELGLWWLHAQHPRDDITSDDLTPTIPASLQTIYLTISQTKREVDVTRQAVDLVLDGIKALPDDVIERLRGFIEEHGPVDGQEEN